MCQSPSLRRRLHIAAGADANGTELPCQGVNGAFVAGCFQIGGTVTTAVIYFEGTVDGSTWVALECVSVGSSATVATSASAAGIWRFNCTGLSAVRARLDWTAGSINVWGTLVS
jgi:hypothetical protein